MAVKDTGRDDTNKRRLDDLPDKPPRPPLVPPRKPLPSHGNLGGSPGLVTSTGGLYGSQRMLLVPYFDLRNGHPSLQVIEDDDWDTEEDGFYYFPSPDIMVARSVSVVQVAIIYKEIGVCSFNVGLIVYNRKDDKFSFKETTINVNNNLSPNIDKVNGAFPDNKLHTVFADLHLDGERPQPYLRRFANSGPMSVVSVTLSVKTDVQGLM